MYSLSLSGKCFPFNEYIAYTKCIANSIVSTIKTNARVSAKFQQAES